MTDMHDYDTTTTKITNGGLVGYQAVHHGGQKCTKMGNGTWEDGNVSNRRNVESVNINVGYLWICHDRLFDYACETSIPFILLASVFLEY